MLGKTIRTTATVLLGLWIAAGGLGQDQGQGPDSSDGPSGSFNEHMRGWWVKTADQFLLGTDDFSGTDSAGGSVHAFEDHVWGSGWAVNAGAGSGLVTVAANGVRVVGYEYQPPVGGTNLIGAAVMTSSAHVSGEANLEDAPCAAAGLGYVQVLAQGSPLAAAALHESVGQTSSDQIGQIGGSLDGWLGGSINIIVGSGEGKYRDNAQDVGVIRSRCIRDWSAKLETRGYIKAWADSMFLGFAEATATIDGYSRTTAAGRNDHSPVAPDIS